MKGSYAKYVQLKEYGWEYKTQYHLQFIFPENQTTKNIWVQLPFRLICI